MEEKVRHRMTPSESHVLGRYWHLREDGRVQCDLCPRFCTLTDGARGLCFVRRRIGNELFLTSYGRSSGFCVDPVEKKALFHFLPGTPTLSFGTAGCNLACKFCQNWSISKSRELDTMATAARPEEIASLALRHDCQSLSFTYNDPVIFLEFMVDTARAARQRGLRTVAVTAGEICAEPRDEFFSVLDATNVDLKGFTESFYRKVCGGSLAPVLDTLEYLVHDTEVWVEITTLLIPGENDDERVLRSQAEWIRERLGPKVPLHFTAFHPDYKMLDHPSTPVSTLRWARELAREEGLEFVYIGNVTDAEGEMTRCPQCDEPLIVRRGYEIIRWGLGDEGHCPSCDEVCPGVFESSPGSWGSRRRPVFVEE